jgi:hypothetical protein
MSTRVARFLRKEEKCTKIDTKIPNGDTICIPIIPKIHIPNGH